MRTLYADVILVCDFCVDYVLLFLCADFLRLEKKPLRLVLSALMGAVFSLLCSIFFTGSLLRFLLGILFLPIMCFVCFGTCGIKTHVRIVVTVYIFSMILGGFMTVATSTLNSGKVTVLMCICCAFLLVFVSKHLSDFFRIRLTSETVSVNVINGHVKKRYYLFCDSGNHLVDPYVNLPMIILKESEIDKLINDSTMLRFVPISTASGQGLVKAFTPDRVVLENNKEEALQVCLGFVRDENLSSLVADGIVPSAVIRN